MKRTGIQIEEKLHAEVKTAAILRQTTFQDAVDAGLRLWLDGTQNAQTVPSDTLSSYGLTAEERRIVETVVEILRDNRPEVRNSAGLIRGRVQEFRTYFSQEATAREKAAHVDEARTIQPSRSRKVG